jgi:hypothetical protein
MTFEEWQKTAKRITDAYVVRGVADAFSVSNAVAIVRHEPGDILELSDGDYLTVFDRDERGRAVEEQRTSGGLVTVQRALWDGWAEWETRVLFCPPAMDEREMYARLALALQRLDAITDGSEWLAQRHIRRVMDAMAAEFLDRTGGDLAWQSTTIPVPQEVFKP